LSSYAGRCAPGETAMLPRLPRAADALLPWTCYFGPDG
jgi:hypothetical protein